MKTQLNYLFWANWLEKNNYIIRYCLLHTEVEIYFFISMLRYAMVDQFKVCVLLNELSRHGYLLRSIFLCKQDAFSQWSQHLRIGNWELDKSRLDWWSIHHRLKAKKKKFELHFRVEFAQGTDKSKSSFEKVSPLVEPNPNKHKEQVDWFLTGF